MHEQHQDSLLPAARQGEDGHETATQHLDLVPVNCVRNTIDIHRSDAKIAMRGTLQGRDQGGGSVNGLQIR